MCKLYKMKNKTLTRQILIISKENYILNFPLEYLVMPAVPFPEFSCAKSGKKLILMLEKSNYIHQ